MFVCLQWQHCKVILNELQWQHCKVILNELQWQHCKVILNELQLHGVGLHFNSTSCRLSP